MLLEGLELDVIDFNDPKVVKTIIERLFNLSEAMYRENLALKVEINRLKDEISRLKGEKGRPQIKPNLVSVIKKDDTRQAPKPENGWKKGSKVDNIKIDWTETIKYNGELPADARHKGYRSVVVQGIVIKRNNVQFRLERYYSPSEGKTYEASVPECIDGGFSAELKSWVIFWYFHSRMSEDKIHQMLTDIGIKISAGEISNILIKGHNRFHEEKRDIIRAGIEKTSYQHIDDTGVRVKGNNQHFSVLCNDYFSAFFINSKKDRLTVLGILSQEKELSYVINPYTLNFLEARGIKSSILISLKAFFQMGTVNKERFDDELEKQIPNLKERQKKMIREAAAISAYQDSHSSSIIQKLICDDAKQFYYVTPLRALCWIHEERHYTKLTPLFSNHQRLVDEFRGRIWGYYRQLSEYKKDPVEEKRIELSNLFDEIFSTVTGYEDLDNRIKLTREKKDSLLVVLDHPDTPLHNNPAELALRMCVIKRKISFGTRSDEGTKGWETFFSIMDTCRKLRVNFREYLYDRISNRNSLPFLAALIPNAP